MIKLLLLLIITSLCFFTNCEDDSNLAINTTGTNIQLHVSGFNNLNGQLVIAVFNNEDSFNSESKTYRDVTIPIISYNNMSILISDVLPGTYVISLFHDEDENGILNTASFLGFDVPEEGFGFSNNPSIGFSQPTYNECVFTIEEGVTLIVPIELIYL